MAKPTGERRRTVGGELRMFNLPPDDYKKFLKLPAEARPAGLIQDR